VPIVLKSGSLKSLEPSGFVQGYIGIALTFFTVQNHSTESSICVSVDNSLTASWREHFIRLIREQQNHTARVLIPNAEQNCRMGQVLIGGAEQNHHLSQVLFEILKRTTIWVKFSFEMLRMGQVLIRGA